MKLLLSISLLIIMIASVAVPVLAQWQSEDLCETKDSKSDSDDEFKVGKEKEVYVSNGYFSLVLAAFYAEETNEKQYYKHDCLISENHAKQLEMPPEA
jgi:hypothetical protein